jgi:uncharacterized protein YgiB involved in biofilm formation
LGIVVSLLSRVFSLFVAGIVPKKREGSKWKTKNKTRYIKQGIKTQQRNYLTPGTAGACSATAVFCSLGEKSDQGGIWEANASCKESNKKHQTQTTCWNVASLETPVWTMNPCNINRK